VIVLIIVAFLGEWTTASFRALEIDTVTVFVVMQVFSSVIELVVIGYIIFTVRSLFKFLRDAKELSSTQKRLKHRAMLMARHLIALSVLVFSAIVCAVLFLLVKSPQVEFPWWLAVYSVLAGISFIKILIFRPPKPALKEPGSSGTGSTGSTGSIGTASTASRVSKTSLKSIDSPDSPKRGLDTPTSLHSSGPLTPLPNHPSPAAAGLATEAPVSHPSAPPPPTYRASSADASSSAASSNAASASESRHSDSTTREVEAVEAAESTGASASFSVSDVSST